ncbi:MAG: response regulator transcription factor [Prevotella sp.]|nr:response regulator transcription factor [Prevotella sp.]
MGKYILADNQELTRFALEALIRQKGDHDIYRATDKVGLVFLLKEHEDAVVLLDYTLFDFADEEQLLIVAERFALSRWILISEELSPRFLRRVVYASHQFSIVYKDDSLKDFCDAFIPSVATTATSVSGRWRSSSTISRKKTDVLDF